MLEEAQDSEIITHVAGLDIGKASLVCCARVPDEARPGRRLQEVRQLEAPGYRVSLDFAA